MQFRAGENDGALRDPSECFSGARYRIGCEQGVRPRSRPDRGAVRWGSPAEGRGRIGARRKGVRDGLARRERPGERQAMQQVAQKLRIVIYEGNGYESRLGLFRVL